jgi:hypothetical protein
LTPNRFTIKNLDVVKIEPGTLPMTIFLILAPYGAFASLMLVTSVAVSLFTGAAVCLAVIAFDAMRRRSIKILGAGSAVLFMGVGGYFTLVDPSLSTSAVKFLIDAGMFLVALGSMLVRHPFTLQYALEEVPTEIAAMPGFMRANYIITGVWTAAMLAMMLGNVAMLYVPGLPIWLSLAVAFAARNSAVYFTKWYPAYRKAKYSPPPALALPKPN